ncbi:MAG: DUF1566 domain-containing protein [bacterium]
MQKRAKIFLCCIRQDKTTVKALHDELKLAGFDVRMNTANRISSEKREREIYKEIKKSHIFLACLSRHSISRKGDTAREIEIALNAYRKMLNDDIKLIPVCLERLGVDEIPEKLQLIQKIDYFAEDGWNSLLRAISTALDWLGVQGPVSYRKTSLVLTEDDAMAMIREKDFCDLQKNPGGKSIRHKFERVENDGKRLVIDHATGLFWQQSGSSEQLAFQDAHRSVQKLNADKYAGYHDWRLPTLEEAMSLMRARLSEAGLFIDPVFDKTQRWIWTADKCTEGTSGFVWVVYFDYGYCYGYYASNYSSYFRAVRC